MNDQSGPILEALAVRKEYESDAGDRPGRAVLDGLSLTVTAGESLAVLGPSGCGKSTLLNLLGALDRPSAGSVRIEGQDLAGLSDRQLAALRARKVGFVFQMHHLLPQCTVWENVLVPTLAGGAGGSGDGKVEDRARELLERVGLGELAGRQPGELSGGERQRAAVVRALINRPRVLLADEPTGSLDAESADRLADLLVELNRRDGLTLVVVTHSQDLARRMGRVLHLRAGRLHEEPG